MSKQRTVQDPAKKPSASEKFLTRWLQTGRGTSRVTSTVDEIKAAIEGLNDSELDEVQEHMIALRRSRFSRLLDLPPEIRNMIYRRCISPEDIETHVTTGRMPSLALLQVNREIARDFSSLYYSPKFMNVYIRDHVEEAVVEVKDPLVFQCLLARWPWSSVDPETDERIDVAIRASSSKTDAFNGKFRVVGAANQAWRHCRYLTWMIDCYHDDRNFFDELLSRHREDEADRRRRFVKGSRPSWC